MNKLLIEEINDPPLPLAAFANIKPYPYAFFLDSGCSYNKLGRFSFLGCAPFLVFRSKGDSITLEYRGGRTETFSANPFSVLKDLLKRYKTPPNDDIKIPFTGGAVGYFSYDLKDFIEELPRGSRDDLKIPDSMLGFYDIVLAYDNITRKAYIANSGHSNTSSDEFKNAVFSRHLRGDRKNAGAPVQLRSNFSKAAYLEAVKKVKYYIKKGDIYQANLSQRFQAKISIDPLKVYSRLRTVSPAPFSAFLDFRDVAVLSSSPERFLSKRGDRIQTRPIKGTRPRGRTQAADTLLSRQLLRSPKDNAEHIMIVDLERNDLGKICRYGSVRHTESAVLERYSSVFHLVSTVEGRLKSGTDPVDCLLAAFPGGSITGAPKVRAMEIIDELEPVKRSVYTGAIGYISFDGNMDTSIAIRTLLVKSGEAYFSVGGGIVADSRPEDEYEETIHKARGMMSALGVEDYKFSERCVETHRTAGK